MEKKLSEEEKEREEKIKKCVRTRSKYLQDLEGR